MRREKKIKIKNFVLKTITVLAYMQFVFSALMIDTGEIKYKALLIISIIWFALFGLANGWFKIASERWDI